MRTVRLLLPSYRQDIALRLRAGGGADPTADTALRNCGSVQC